jgi:hypothetical protein
MQFILRRKNGARSLLRIKSFDPYIKAALRDHIEEGCSLPRNSYGFWKVRSPGRGRCLPVNQEAELKEASETIFRVNGNQTITYSRSRSRWLNRLAAFHLKPATSVQTSSLNTQHCRASEERSVVSSCCPQELTHIRKHRFGTYLLLV